MIPKSAAPGAVVVVAVVELRQHKGVLPQHRLPPVPCVLIVGVLVLPGARRRLLQEACSECTAKSERSAGTRQDARGPRPWDSPRATA